MLFLYFKETDDALLGCDMRFHLSAFRSDADLLLIDSFGRAQPIVKINWTVSKSLIKIINLKSVCAASNGRRKEHQMETRKRTIGSWPGLLYCISRWLIGLLFLYSGITKLLDPAGFALIVDDFGLLPEAWATVAAIGIAGLEALSGIGLIFEIKGSLTAITGLLMLFIAVLAYGIHLGLDIDCGCFGPDDPEAAVYGGLRQALYRDIAFMGCVAYLYWWRLRQKIETVWRPEWGNLFPN